MQAAIDKAIGVGRTIAIALGVGVRLALTVGFASTALAGTGVGTRYDLGRINTVDDATTQLVGSIRAPMFSITNQSDGRVCDATERRAARAPGDSPPPVPQPCTTNPAPALGLNVRAGQAPLAINAEAGTAKNLSADELGGKDSAAFFSGKTYTRSDNNAAPNSYGVVADAAATCDPGDPALSGGYGLISAANLRDDFAVFAESISGSTNSVSAKGLGPNFTFLAPNVTCADFPPLKP